MSTISVQESMIGLKVTTLQGEKDKIMDVTTRGYKLETRRSQVRANQLVKKGKGFIEIERPSAKEIEDSGMGYATIIDADLFMDVFGKKMPKVKKEAKADKKAKPSKADKKAKAKPSKATKKEKPVVREEIDLLTDFGKRIPEGLRIAVQNAITEHLNKFSLPGTLRVLTKMDVFEFMGDDGAVGAMNVGIHFDLPEVSVPTVSAKTMEKVNAGLWEKKDKVRKSCFKRFSADFDLYDIFIDDEGDEYIFAGISINKKKKPVMIFHRPEDETCIKCTISTAAERLVIAPQTPESDDDIDLSDFSSEDADLVDAEELDEATKADRNALIDEDALLEMKTVSEMAEYLADFEHNVLANYFTSMFEDLNKRDRRVVKSGDTEALAKLIAESLYDSDGSDTDSDEVAEDSDDDFAEFDDTTSVKDESDTLDDKFGSDDSDTSEECEGLSNSDLSDAEEDVSEVPEDDIDAMIDLLVEDKFITTKESRRITPEKTIELYTKHYSSEDVNVDDAADQLVEDGHIKNSAIRKLTDVEIVELYNSIYSNAEYDVDSSDDSDTETEDGSDTETEDGSDTDSSDGSDIDSSDGSDIDSE